MTVLAGPIDGEPSTQACRGFVREDVQAVMTVFRLRSKEQIEIDKSTRFNLSRAHLAGAELTHIDLTSAFLDGANLTGAFFTSANLTGAFFTSANLTGANLRSCEGLCQIEIDYAKVDSYNPPKLEGVVDAETGKPIVWRE